MKEIYYFTEDIIHRNSSFKFDKLVHSESYFNPSDMPAEWTQKIEQLFIMHFKIKVCYFKGDYILKFTPNADEIDKVNRDLLIISKRSSKDCYGGNIEATFFNSPNRNVFLFKGECYI